MKRALADDFAPANASSSVIGPGDTIVLPMRIREGGASPCRFIAVEP